MAFEDLQKSVMRNVAMVTIGLGGTMICHSTLGTVGNRFDLDRTFEPNICLPSVKEIKFWNNISCKFLIQRQSRIMI